MKLSIKNIAVLQGGPSAEREVSLRSGAAVTQALRELGYQVTPIDVAGPDFVLPQETELAFLCLHGTFGEDGQVQQILKDRGVPYTGSGVAASRRAFDKHASKEAFKKAGVPTPEGELLRRGQKPSLPLPLVLKPNRQGSSIGLHFVTEGRQIEPALADAFKYDNEIVVEQMVQGRELTVGILGDQPLPVVEIKPKSGHYDYQSKYTPGATEYFCPAVLLNEQRENIQAAALGAHWALHCRAYSRVDILLDEKGLPWVLEVNTIPGMTGTSLLPKAAAATGIYFGDLCEKIMELSLQTPEEGS